jgi:hypothetical protein
MLRRVRVARGTEVGVVSRRREWSAVAVVPVAAVLVHELRFLFAYGPAAAGELAATGHSYLHELTPWLGVAFAFGLGLLLVRVARAWRTGDAATVRAASFERLWLAATAVLVAIYGGQELLEGVFAPGHPTGLAGVFGDGGLWALPASALVGAGLALWVRGADAAVARVARLRGASVASLRGMEVRPYAPRPVVVSMLSPLAASAAGRAPPS